VTGYCGGHDVPTVSQAHMRGLLSLEDAVVETNKRRRVRSARRSKEPVFAHGRQHAGGSNTGHLSLQHRVNGLARSVHLESLPSVWIR